MYTMEHNMCQVKHQFATQTPPFHCLSCLHYGCLPSNNTETEHYSLLMTTISQTASRSFCGACDAAVSTLTLLLLTDDRVWVDVGGGINIKRNTGVTGPHSQALIPYKVQISPIRTFPLWGRG